MERRSPISSRHRDQSRLLGLEHDSYWHQLWFPADASLGQDGGEQDRVDLGPHVGPIHCADQGATGRTQGGEPDPAEDGRGVGVIVGIDAERNPHQRTRGKA